MAISADILVPRVIALAAVGYCVWPSLTVFVSETASKPPAKLPAVETALLRPKMLPQPVRDPFRVQVAVETGSRRRSSKAGGGIAAGGAAGDVAAKPVNPLDGLTLGGTCIVGTQRLAVINGRLYAAQEMLRPANPATPPLKITNVLPYKVLLKWEGKVLELTYANVASSLVASDDANVFVGGPDGVTAGSGTKKPHAFTGARSSGNSRVNGAGK